MTGEAPGGPAGGDLSGSYPNPEVEQSSTGAFTVKGTLITESAIQIRALAAKTANYIVMSADAALSFINSPTVTFGAALSNGQVVLIENIGAGVVTLAAANAGSIVGVTSVPANSGVLCYVASAGTNPVVWVVSPPAASGGAALGWANYPYNGATSGGNLEWQTGMEPAKTPNGSGPAAPGFDYSGGVGDGFTLINFPADSITLVTASLFIDVTASVNARYAAQWLPSNGTPFAPVYELSIDTAVGAGQEIPFAMSLVFDSVALAGQTLALNQIVVSNCEVDAGGGASLSLLSVPHP